MCEHGSNVGEFWELQTYLKCVLKGKHCPQKLRSHLLHFDYTQLYHSHGGFDGSSKNTRLLHKKTGLQVPTVGILLLMLVFVQVHHYSIEGLDAPEERRITALKSNAGNEENINAAAG